MRTKIRPRSSEQGVALVVTMIVVAVMAMVAVAFMQGAGTDRSSSRSFVAHYQARLAADAGAQCAVSSVRRTLCFGGNPTNTNSAFGYHDAVTVWQNIGGAATNEATVLYVRAKSGNNSNQGAKPGEFGPDIQILARPLVSGGQFVPLSSIGTNMPFNTNDPSLMREMVNLNATNALNPDPWIGYRSAPVAGAPVTAARWVYVSRDGGPTNANNPPIARYAYWVEDESFKANLNVLTNGVRGMNSGTSPQQGTIDGVLGASANLSTFTGRTTAMLQDRATLGAGGFTDRGSAALALGLQGVTNAAEFRFLTTVNSAGLDLSRGGFKRVNINALTNADKRAGLDRIIAAITNTNAAPLFGQRFYRLANTPAGINSTSAVSTNHAAIYLQKIAANIYDYLDDDDQPTVITNNASFSLVTGRPTDCIRPLGGEGLDGTNSIAAMGVENVPRLQEYAIHLRVRSMRWDTSNPNIVARGDSFGFVFNTNEGAVNPTTAKYEVWLDHYFEFWNPGTRNFTNSPDTFLKIVDQPAWGPGTGGGVVTGEVGRGSGSFVTNNRASSEIPLVDALTGAPVVFPAGEVTVLTTADFGPTLNYGANSADFLVVTTNPLAMVTLANVPAADRVFFGTTSSILTTNYIYDATAVGGGPNFGYNRLFEVAMQYGRAGGTGTTDYASGVFIGNNQGIIESHVGLPIGNTNGTSKFSAIVESSFIRNDLTHVPGHNFHGYLDNVRGGGLRGNANNGASTAKTKPNTIEGDPRTLSEQLEFTIYDPARGNDQTRFWNTMGPGSGPSSTFANSTFGRPNANYVRAANWTDYSSISSGASNAPLFVRNGAMQTIGELGHITDPARPYITSGTVPTLARGGGRTLRVGQSELTNFGGTNIGWYDGNQTNASRTWTSWRLADVFTTTGAVTIPGLINPNGALRDGGAALRAALHGLTYLPSPEGVGLPPLNDFRINGILSAVARRMTNAAAAGLPSGSLNPFWERGEISELPIFNTGNIPTTMSNKFDRGREELVRRSIEMITTRGSIFTVYVIGQALQAASQTTNVLGSFRLKQTLEISPQYFAPEDAFNDSFPLTGPRFPRRFSAPTNYTVRVLATSYD